MSTKKVLIVILNYITYDLTLQLVEELKRFAFPNTAVMVIDNCSPNNSANVLAAEAETGGYIFYANDINSGYAAGNNIGIRYAIAHGYDYTWILNNDVKIQDKCILQKMLDVAESSDNIGCVGPKIFSLEGKECLPYCDRPTFWTMTLGIVSGKIKRKSQTNVSQFVYRIHGCCMLLRNSIMQRIDCMDERTFLYNEEDILAERMLNVGSVSYYCAETSLIHMESTTVKITFGAKNKQRIKMTLDSLEIYLRDYRRYNWLSRFLCKLTRGVIIALRS
jgi:GT2 family glycosyltransferase